MVTHINAKSWPRKWWSIRDLDKETRFHRLFHRSSWKFSSVKVVYPEWDRRGRKTCMCERWVWRDDLGEGCCLTTFILYVCGLTGPWMNSHSSRVLLLEIESVEQRVYIRMACIVGYGMFYWSAFVNEGWKQWEDFNRWGWITPEEVWGVVTVNCKYSSYLSIQNLLQLHRIIEFSCLMILAGWILENFFKIFFFLR